MVIFSFPMIVLMQLEATQAQIEAVCDVIRESGLEPLVLPGQDRVAIGIPAVVEPSLREHLESLLGEFEGVSKVTQVSRPYKLASLEFNRVRTSFDVKGVPFGPGNFTMIAGPCSVEGYDEYKSAGKVLKAQGVKVLRGGAFKPRTSPYSFQGLQEEGLKIIKSVGDELGLVTITEVMSGDKVEVCAQYVDILQIGARSIQNFPLLIEAGKSGKPVFLKRGPASTIDEYLLAAEYILNQGNSRVILCERGVVPLERSYVRNTFDINAIPVLLDNSHLPVFADPSHACGVAKYVPRMTMASMVAGAQGAMVEMHLNPKKALSDGSQALTPDQFALLMTDLKKLAIILNINLV